MNESQDQKLDEQLRTAMGTPAAPDFDAFRRRHAAAVAHLNPVVTATVRRRRQAIVKAVSLAVAAAILLAAGTWLFAPREPAFAQAIKTIDKAETISMVYTSYTRMYSEDGQRTWLRKDGRMERMYMAPNFFRDTRYDTEGNIASVDIEDTKVAKVLRLDMKKKTAMLKGRPSGQFPPFGSDKGSPFFDVAKTMAKETIEHAGQREVNGVKANVFRYSRTYPRGGRENFEIWLDPTSKKLLGEVITTWFEGYGAPKETFFDPATAPDRNNPPEARFKKGEMAGTIISDIVFDPKLDANLFSLTPPEGFEIVEEKPRTKVSEERLAEWLRVLARVNNGQFVDSVDGLNSERQVALSDKPKAERSEVEQQYMALAQRNAIENNGFLISRFAEDSTEPKSFRYLGKGVRLGDAERIVCFYKLKDSDKYRAVHGDLSIKEIEAKDLPLPVEE